MPSSPLISFEEAAAIRARVREMIRLSTDFKKGEPGARPATLYVDYQRDEGAGTRCGMIFHGRTIEFTESGSG